MRLDHDEEFQLSESLSVFSFGTVDHRAIFELIDPRAGKIIARVDNSKNWVPKTAELGQVPDCAMLDLYDEFPSLQEREVGAQLYGDLRIHCFGKND